MRASDTHAFTLRASFFGIGETGSACRRHCAVRRLQHQKVVCDFQRGIVLRQILQRLEHPLRPSRSNRRASAAERLMMAPRGAGCRIARPDRPLWNGSLRGRTVVVDDAACAPGAGAASAAVTQFNKADRAARAARAPPAAWKSCVCWPVGLIRRFIDGRLSASSRCHTRRPSGARWRWSSRPSSAQGVAHRCR